MLPEVHLKEPTVEEFRLRFLHYLRYTCGLELRQARAADHLAALERAVRESMIDRQILTSRTYDEVRPKTVHYLSMEYLLGRLMLNNLISTGLLDTAREAMQLLGLLPRLVGNSRLPRLRLRPAVRLRHVQPIHRKRLAG